MPCSDATGQTFSRRLRIHAKVLIDPNIPLSTMLQKMQSAYKAADILVDLVSTENLSLPDLEDLDVGECVQGSTTQAQEDLFKNRSGATGTDVVVYFVRSTVPPFNGCAAHPQNAPGAVIVQTATQWTMGHEVGHVLGLIHVNDNTRLMTGNGTANISKDPPDLVSTEVGTMQQSGFAPPC